MSVKKLVSYKIVPNVTSESKNVYTIYLETVIESRVYSLAYYAEIVINSHNELNNTKTYHLKIIKDIELYITGEDKSYLKTYSSANNETFLSMFGKEIILL